MTEPALEPCVAPALARAQLALAGDEALGARQGLAWRDLALQGLSASGWQGFHEMPAALAPAATAAGGAEIAR